MSDDAAARIEATGLAILLGVGGLSVMALCAQGVGAALAAAGVEATPGTAVGELVPQVGILVGALIVAALYLGVSGRGLPFLDLRAPNSRDAGYAVGGLLAILGIAVGIEALFGWLGVETATHGVEEQARGGAPGFLLVLIPGSLLFVGPGEELLYRNLIQKRLTEAFPAWRAVALTSGVFALVHTSVFSGGDGTGAVVASLAVAFVLSLVLGVVYHRTRSLPVVAFVHGGYDAVVYATMYIQYG
jgi:membrane protease YdiL (CAAX protease family)